MKYFTGGETMNLIIKLSSVTYALKARDTLKLKGVRSTVEKNPRPKMKEGCSYILYVYNAPKDTISLLESHGIPVTEAVWK